MKAQSESVDTLERGVSFVAGGDEDVALLDESSVESNSDEKCTKKSTRRETTAIRFLWDEVSSYWNLFRKNRGFRLAILSYIFGQMGEWLSYIAVISLVQRLVGEDNPNYHTSLGITVLIRLLPAVLLSPVGGVLADSRDKRKTMIVLDLLGATTPLVFLVATFFESSMHGISILYFGCLCQATVYALYEPCRVSLLPLLVIGNDDDLKRATTLSGISWAATSCFGSALGGFVTSYYGARACFCLDSCSYILSAFLMYQVGGSWTVAPKAGCDSVWKLVKSMTFDGAKYLLSSSFGMLVFFNATGNLVTGAFDVLNYALSEQSSGGMWLFDTMDTEQKLGVIVGIAGIGYIIGPAFSEPFTDPNRPKGVQLMCILGLLAILVGCLGISNFHPYWLVCLFSLIRAAGVGVLWLNSQFLLQKLTPKDMLGRVSAVDQALALLSAALSSLWCGVLQDRIHLDADQVSGVQGFLCAVFLVSWAMYHFSGRGAACLTSFEDNVPMKKGS